jgi:hypothetical protein
LEDFELQEFFEETMNNEFDTLLEDDSALQLARLLIKFFQMYKSGKIEELNLEISKLSSNKSSSNIKASMKAPSNENDSDDSDDDMTDGTDSDDNNMNEDCDENNNDNSQKTSKNKQLTDKETQDFDMVEEGWTFVAKSGKQFTKQ